MTRYVWLVVLMLAGWPSRVAGQDPLTLDEAVQRALTQNAALRAVRAGRDEADAQRTQARSGFFPRVTLTESWQRGDQPVFVFSSLLSARQFAAGNFAVDALNHPDPVGFFRATLGVEQVVFDGGRQRAATDAAGLRREIAGLGSDEAAASLMLATTQTFARIIAAQAVRRAAEAGVAAAREDLIRTERRRDGGMATAADVLGLAVHLADLQQREIQADGDAAVARAELNRLMGDAIDHEHRFVEPVMIASAGAASSLEAQLAEADAARPEIRRAAAAQQLADAGRRQAHAASIPQVAAQAGFDVSGTRFNERASSWIVGGEVRWIFSLGGAELAQTKAATAAVARAQADAEDARAAVHVEVVSALRKLEAARARHAVGRAAAEQARESQRIIRDRFDAGLVPVNDVLRASTAVLDADTQSIAALVDVTVSEALLNRALGRAR